jgi:hypothetical protein
MTFFNKLYSIFSYIDEERLILLKPVPTFKDYTFSMNKSDGLCDIFGIKVKNEEIEPGQVQNE